MIARFLYILSLVTITAGCSFDAKFFPRDNRPDEKVDFAIERNFIEAKDGAKLETFLIKPSGEPKATIFVFQGSGNKAINWVKVITPLLENNYQIFMMDYRGFGNSEGVPSHLAVLDDAYTAFEYLVKQEWIQNKKLAVLGQSYGGQLAINVSTKFQKQVDALITEGTFSSFTDVAMHATPWYGRVFTWMIFSNPYESKEIIKTNKVPKLFVHSEEEEIAPIAMAHVLHENSPGPKELWAIKGKHIDGFKDYPDEFVKKINQLLGL